MGWEAEGPPLPEGHGQGEGLVAALAGPTITCHIDEQRIEELCHAIDPWEEVPLPSVGLWRKVLEGHERVRLVASAGQRVNNSND